MDLPRQSGAANPPTGLDPDALRSLKPSSCFSVASYAVDATHSGPRCSALLCVALQFTATSPGAEPSCTVLVPGEQYRK
ncbi:hypothetical protein EYF80_035149 [Liparis tanakae]|uniref:Uncharacterized protein n=1 Tax=Liparis tanakae TaxID=230148 RepID=A0A4Z2GM82_9TELE|nr:hypothetical protein EYF80_035149 [Liparis tanakae]